MSTFPRRGETHELEDRGKRFFLASIPSSWVVHEPRQGADYGTDFIIDMPSSDGLCRGASFRAQMKASSTAVAEDGLVKVRLEVRHLRYLLVRPEPAMPVFYVDDSPVLYFAWLDQYRPNDDCSNDHPWWRCARPLPTQSAITFEIDANDRIDASDFEAKIEKSIYDRHEVWFQHHIFWPTVDALVDDDNPRRFRNFSRAPCVSQYLEVSIVPRQLVLRRDAVARAKAAIGGGKPKGLVEEEAGIHWRPPIGEAKESFAQFRNDGFCCVAWTREQTTAHIEVANVAEVLGQLFSLWRAAIGDEVEVYLEVAGLRVQGISLNWLGMDYPLRRFYFYAGMPVSPKISESVVNETLGKSLIKKLEWFALKPLACYHAYRSSPGKS